MRTGNLKAAGLVIVLALAALGLVACGSGGDGTTTADRPAVSVATANRLALLSDRIASELDAGDICHAAHAADDLRSAVEQSDLPASVRPGRPPATRSTRPRRHRGRRGNRRTCHAGR